MSIIKNIIFDVGNVIIKDKANYALDLLDIDKKTYNIINDRFFNDVNDIDLGINNIEKHYIKANIDEFLGEKDKDILLHYYKYRPFNNDIISLIKRLKDNNYNVYILSNNNVDVRDYLLTQPFFKYIDGYVFSCDCHLIKPDVSIYNELFNKYNLIPNECFFIDDKQENIDTGIGLGMKGHVFDYTTYGTTKLIDDLKNEKVL